MKIATNNVLSTALQLPVVPTMDVVVFPNMIVPLLVLDERIIKGIDAALQGELKQIFLLASNAQETAQNGERFSVSTQDLYQVGTIATVMRVIKIPEGGIKILVQGMERARVLSVATQQDLLTVQVEAMPFIVGDPIALSAHIKTIKELAETMSNNNGMVTPDFHLILSKLHEAQKVADFLLSHLSMPVTIAQTLLESATYEELFIGLYQQLAQENEVAQVQERIRNLARDSMNKSQKEFYLREQIKAIKKELGDDDLEEMERFHKRLEQLSLPAETQAELKRQLTRLERLSPDSMESSVLRNYIEYVLAMPWGITTTDNLDLEHARSILNADHYGLKDIKERILDFISIKTLNQESHAPILCFAGPPGTGKTSLGKSIARCLGRNYSRISLGGVKDEAEIRGHRRTYVGALPGRFIQAVKKSGSMNPVIIIDELDKLGNDFRGDPSAAMLEVLDPQQNKSFYDNYLGVQFDLSQILFIATANTIDAISEPLRDRMEIIHLSGYTIEEKMMIAQQHLIKQAHIESGLPESVMPMLDKTVEALIFDYTREAGVRDLGRILKKVYAKLARLYVEKGSVPIIDIPMLSEFLGSPRYLADDVDHLSHIGITNGLAWTAFGGEIIKIEAVVMPGKGQLILTGQLGSVMKESAQAALSYIRAHAADFDISAKMFSQYDLHIHVPAGGIPKDGPSAGVTMLSSILSAFTQRPIHADYAMTGEINLRGNVMPIGGIKEKILAAKRNRIPYVILPNKNKNDIKGLEDILTGINLIWVEHADEVLARVLMPKKVAVVS
jgi:ATP-dependent Lon protease